MNFLNYIFLCLSIGVYLFFHLTNTPTPGFLRTVNLIVCWAFLLWGGYIAGKVIIDCIQLGAKGQMQPVHIREGILLATINYLPVVMMSVFMLKEGYK
ncbi:MAG: hypothetical protein ACKV1O_22475 [Saprospiraceae bacterium]